jgi:hypothetical protein
MATSEINLEAVEDYTNFSDDEHIEVEHINFEFEQCSKMRGLYRKTTIFNDSQCYQSVKNKHQTKTKYRIDLAYLDPKPIRRRNKDWKWLIASLAMSGLGIAIIFGGWIDTASVNFLGLLVGATVVALMTLLAFFHQSNDKVIFRSQYGKIRIIELINNNPDKARFRSFITKFIVQINKSRTAGNHTAKKFLANELKQLRRLKDESVIPQEAYEKAKKRIFRHEAFKAGE